jgi:ABC-type multidrug transport system ATPase subunit
VSLLSAEDVRIDVDGVPACDGITFRTTGERVLVLGAPRPLSLAAAGVLPVARGRLMIRGVDAAVAVGERGAAGAALDPPLPPTWTVREYVQWSARLAGLDKATAKANATDAIGRLQLVALEKAPLLGLPPHAKRALVLAAAIATGAPVLAVEDPLTGLPEDVARSYAQIFLDALRDRAWIVFAARMPLTSPLALHAHEAIVASSSRVEAQGPPAELASASSRFVARVHGPMETLATQLQGRGIGVEIHGGQVVFDLNGVLSTSELIEMCAAADVAIVELVPVARALV